MEKLPSTSEIMKIIRQRKTDRAKECIKKETPEGEQEISKYRSRQELSNNLFLLKQIGRASPWRIQAIMIDARWQIGHY